ncbi:MAG: helix-turn-helix domain-containing protein [Proteobacteria bacterium]|nr:helix-turn-helix domain-containing protein [Pseudomonadota bacterium]
MAASVTPIYLTVSEAAKRAKVPDNTMRSWLRRGRVRSVKRSGHIMVDAQSLDDFLAAKKPHGSAAKPANGELTRDEFARAAGISERTASRLKETGEIDDYTEAELQAFQDDPGDTTSFQEAKRRKELAAAKLAELRLAREKDQLYEAQNVEKTIQHLADAARAELQAVSLVLPGKIARLVPELDETRRSEVEAAVRQLCITLANVGIERLVAVVAKA